MQALVDLITGLIQFTVFVAVVLAIVAAWGYNTLRKFAEDVREAQSNVDIALRKKVSLINRLSEVARQYGERESLVMLKVSQDATEAAIRQTYQQSGTVLSTIQGMAQKFPDLKTSDQFKELAPAIDRAENDLQSWRVRCNSAIKNYNSRRGSLPHTLYATFLGFKAARYLELDSVESVDASVERPLISDDGDRLNELLGLAGSKVLGATKTLAAQGKLIAERATARAQSGASSPVASAVAVEYHYLDAERNPKGPVSREGLDALFRSGAISNETDVLAAGSPGWTKYESLDSTRRGL